MFQVVDTALREDFGFEQLLWVYSGRRGVHCWVCDQRARALTNDLRSAVAEYLSVVTGADSLARKVNLKHPIHPSVERAISISKDYFNKWIVASADKDGLVSHFAIAATLLRPATAVPREGRGERHAPHVTLLLHHVWHLAVT